jgi:rhodanese-related sulfurtransferase
MLFLPAIRKIAVLLTLVITWSSLFAQYKNDNVAFKTVYMEEFCKQFKSNPNAVLLDVRSQGEYDDTSRSVGLNIGRLKATAHIDINQLPSRWRELLPYKDQPIYVYCSHSQRSRRASKLLADSGFTKVVNINGGLTYYNMLEMQKQCADLYQTSNAYKLISPFNICNFLSNEKDVFIIDVRKDSSFNGMAVEERQNAYGKFRNSVNIPLDRLSHSIATIPKGKPILVVDEFGNNAVTAAKLLFQNEFLNVSILYNGFDALISADKTDLGCINQYWQHQTPYTTVTPIEFDQLAKKEKNLQIIDVRPAEEFKNESKTTWRNIGAIKGAANIPLTELEAKLSTLDKNKPVLVYQFGGPDAFTAAKTLTNKGYSKVYVLTPGLFSLRWQAANLSGKSNLKNWVVNVPEENR